MAFEIPSARIRQLQEDLRREAGLPSYDLSDSPLPQLPSIAEAVRDLDPDLPPSLCCDRCGGGLLRGARSTLCMYCGADRSKEAPPHSISFSSTVGCRKLLDFLGLDGSEDVFFVLESSDSNKSQEAHKSGLVLSEILAFELTWPSDKEVVDIDTTTTTPSPNIYALSSTGVDLDNFFSERNRVRLAIASEHKEKVMPRKNTDKQVHVSYGSENFAAFEKMQTAGAESSSIVSNFGESFAVWSAEFQPASANNSAVNPKSLDLFQDSSVHGCTATTAKASACQLENIDVLTATVNKQSDGDFCPIESANINASIPRKPKTAVGTNDFNVQDDLWPTSSTEKSENSNHINSHDDLFDPWQDFTSSIGKRSSSSQEPDAGPSLFENSNETKSVTHIPENNKNDMGENKLADGKNDAVEHRQYYSSFERLRSSSRHGTQSGVTFSGHSLEAKSADPLHTSADNGPESLATIDNLQYSSDVWQDFAGFDGTSEDLFNQISRTGDTSSKVSLRTNSADPRSTSNINNLDKNKSSYDDDESFDDWQDFASFSNGPERSANLGIPSDPTLHEQHTKPVDSCPTKGETESANGLDKFHDSSGVWQDFAASRKTPEDLFNRESQSGAKSSKDPLGTNSVDSWPTSNINDIKDKSFHGDDDSDDWQDFTSVSKGPERSGNVGTPSGPTLFEQPSETKSVDSWPTKRETESKNWHNDVFDDWRDFTSSIQAQQSSPNPEEQSKIPLAGHPSETNTVYQQGTKIHDFPQTWGPEKDYPDGTDIFGKKEADHKTTGEPNPLLWDTTEGNKSSNANSNSRSEKSEVDKSASLPDLSFMLVDELSIPKEPSETSL